MFQQIQSQVGVALHSRDIFNRAAYLVAFAQARMAPGDLVLVIARPEIYHALEVKMSWWEQNDAAELRHASVPNEEVVAAVFVADAPCDPIPPVIAGDVIPAGLLQRVQDPVEVRALGVQAGTSVDDAVQAVCFHSGRVTGLAEGEAERRTKLPMRSLDRHDGYVAVLHTT